MDLNLVEPAGRLVLGAGYAESSGAVGTRSLFDTTEKYLFLKIRLDKSPGRPKRVFPLPPTATYTETEVSPAHRVHVEEHDKGFRELRP